VTTGTETDFRALGREAYRAGQPRKPIDNQVVVDAIADSKSWSPWDSESRFRVMSDFAAGWDAEAMGVDD
jgi:hypothetical protein